MPHNVNDVKDKIELVLNNENWKNNLKARGFDRSKDLSRKIQ